MDGPVTGFKDGPVLEFRYNGFKIALPSILMFEKSFPIKIISILMLHEDVTDVPFY